MGIAQRVAAQRMLNRQQELVTERVLSAVRGAVTTYATISASQMRETTAIAAWALGRMIEMWVDGSALTAADLTRFRGIGVARATDGRPLPAVLRAYRVAAVEINELIIELVGDTLEIEDVVALNRTLLRSADELSEAILAGYETAREQLDSNRDQMVRALTDDLLTGRQTAPAVLADRCAQLGIAAPGRLTIVVVGAASALSDGDVAELASLLPGSLWTRRGRAGVLLAAKAPDLRRELGFRKWRACVVADVAPVAVPREFRLAAAALENAPVEAYDAGPVLGRADAMLAGLLRGEPAVDPAQLAVAVLGAVAEPGNAHLLEGLHAYLRHGSSNEAALALGLHAQTMRHRLRRITELTGRDVRRSWDRLLLDVARSAHRPGAGRETGLSPAPGLSPAI